MPLCIALAFFRKSSIYYLALAKVEVCVSKYVYEALEDINLSISNTLFAISILIFIGKNDIGVIADHCLILG